ncbi:hypothetical protein F511_30707 [Dorcoceras hygrometricum]|uniref:Uncharacterized protein n=1 Tax=Dorcoceras hygrometricum TaxID=472368 RepID=A0A2Z7B0Z2_9LAMI|nr:hypothetical protein F511_30707 [Dorcoceras hygrometricum]
MKELQCAIGSIGFSVQIVLSSLRSELFGTLVVVIVAQKLTYGFELVLQLWISLDICVCLLDASIEAERQYRAPHLTAGLVVSRYEQVDIYHALMSFGNSKSSNLVYALVHCGATSG